MDIVDRAKELEERHRQAALAARHHHKAGESRTHCLQCDEVIPEGRRQAVPGVTHCARCQNDRESNKGY